jgi:hypothetical protein
MHGKNTVRVGKPSIGIPTPPEATLEIPTTISAKTRRCVKTKDMPKVLRCQEYIRNKTIRGVKT